MNDSSERLLTSMRALTCAMRRLSNGTRLCPPAKTLVAPSPCANNDSASSTDSGRAYPNRDGFTGSSPNAPCVNVLACCAWAAATLTVRIPTQLCRMRQVLSEIAPRTASAGASKAKEDKPLSLLPAAQDLFVRKRIFSSILLSFDDWTEAASRGSVSHCAQGRDRQDNGYSRTDGDGLSALDRRRASSDGATGCHRPRRAMLPRSTCRWVARGFFDRN